MSVFEEYGAFKVMQLKITNIKTIIPHHEFMSLYKNYYFKLMLDKLRICDRIRRQNKDFALRMK